MSDGVPEQQHEAGGGSEGTNARANRVAMRGGPYAGADIEATDHIQDFVNRSHALDTYSVC